MGPLLYLTLCSMKNRVRVRVRRLKEPRYLIGTVVGLVYFWGVFFRPRSRSRNRPPGAGTAGGALALISNGRGLVEVGGAAALFVITALAWAWPGNSRPALSFTRADVQFLFPAPISRSRLIRYKVFRSQLGALLGSAFMTLFFRPSTFAEGWMFFVGIAVVMAILNLHMTGISLSRDSLGRDGLASVVRKWLPPVLVVSAFSVMVVTVVMAWPHLTSLANTGEVIDEVYGLASSGPIATVLWPFRALARLPLSETPADFLRALPWVLLILGLNYVWVLRSNAAFEEGSAERAEKIAHAVKGARPTAPKASGVLATPFTLSLEGRPEMAIFWKNLIMVGRYLSLKSLLRFLPIFVILGVAFTRNGRAGLPELFGGACLLVFIMSVLLGPQIARNDLRQDLTNLGVLKTWPVRGAALVRGEIMAPAAILIVVSWFSAIGGLLVATRLDFAPSFAIAAILLSPGVILMQLLVQNGIAVMWPSWAVIGSNRARGIDVMGQRMIMMVGLLLVLVLAVLPAALAGGLVMGAFYWMTGAVTIIVPAIVAAIVLFAEVFLASELVGKLFDRTDVSAIDATEG